MKKHVAMKWAKTLRSGKYEQATKFLQVDQKYCCLGVLCRIAPKSVKKVIKSNGKLSGVNLDYQSHVWKWSGIRTTEGRLLNANGTYGKISLAFNNDYGMSFKEIADTIEANWEKL